MTLSGGATDKFGNYYEGLWTIDRLLDILDEQADSICLEPPGENGFEFWLSKLKNNDEDWDGVTFKSKKDGVYEYHQVKTKSTEHWTISKLETKEIKVLSNFKRKLDDEPQAKCIFICNCGASELNELVKKAKNFQDETQFIINVLSIDTWKKEFSKLFCKWNNEYTDSQFDEYLKSIKTGNLSPEQKKINQLLFESYQRLKRISVIIIDKDTLTKNIESSIRYLIEPKNNNSFGDKWWSTVRYILSDFISINCHQELNQLDIWNYLYEHGYQRREWGKNHHVLAALENCNNQYINKIKNSIIINYITRDETQTALNNIKDNDKNNHILLTGEAGVGKSGIILQIVEELKTKNIPILVFRIDNLKSTINPDHVGEKLSLPTSPALVIANIAKSHNKQGILIIDQLDAVSLASGRNSDFFDCISNIIQQAIKLNLKLILACRKFDLDNDHRLKQLTGKDGIAKTIIINPLSNEKVREALKKLGLDIKKINPKQIKLLSLPLHLGLLAEIAKDSTIDVFSFETSNDLFDKYWDSKQRAINKRLNCSIKWTEVIDKLCDDMSKKQTLSASQSIVDQYFQDVEVMVSEHILIKENKRLRFFHESFFDYAFARRFAGRGKDLLSFLRENEQHLFRRSQVRQILAYERNEDFEQYLDDLEELLNSCDIRFHIKQVTIALLSTLNEPTEDEWDIIYPLIKDENNWLSQNVWGMLHNSVAWFKLLDSLGIIEQWLRDNNKYYVDNTVLLLRTMQRQIPEKVAELLEPFINKSEIWNNHLFNIVNGAELHNNRYFFEFFLKLINQGALDKYDFLQLIFALSDDNSDWACKAIGSYLNRCLDLYLDILDQNKENIKSYNINPFKRISLYDNDLGIIEDTQYSNLVLETAKKAPQSFLEFVFPFILRVIDVTADKDTKLPWQDNVWRYRSYGVSYSIDQYLLEATEIAFSSLAKNNYKYFSEFIKKHQLQSSKFDTIQFLLIRAYTANGEHFVNEAVEYLCKNPVRLKTGYSVCTGNSHAAPFWATRELLQAITPHCTGKKLTKLEELILNYYPEWEKHKDYRALHGYAQVVLLDAIDNSRISNNAKRRLQELMRKFISNGLLEKTGKLEETGKIEPPKSIEAYSISSPIPQDSTKKMTDKQWLKAIVKYNYTDGFERTGELRGSAWQLSSELEKEVRKDPIRFAKLIQQFSNNTHTSYFDAVLRGIAQTDLQIDVSTAFSVCQKCNQLPEKPCGREISWLFQKLAHLPWEEEALDMVIYYAINDPDPQQELWHTKATGDQVYYDGDILTAGINSVRGKAVSAIAQLIFKDKNRAVYFYETLEQIVKDSSIAVRSCVAEVLTAVLNYNQDLAVKLFIQLCDTEDILLKTNTVNYFLYYALPTHFQDLKAIVTRMINSEIPEVQEIGAKRIFVISLINEEAQILAQQCLSGTENHRKAAAEVYAGNLVQADYRDFCKESLIKFFNDKSKEVRSQASRFFYYLKEQRLTEYLNIIDAFIESLAFKENYNDLLLFLRPDSFSNSSNKSSELPPQTIYKICQRFVEVVGFEATDIQTGAFADAKDISELLIQIYSQKNRDSQFQSDCLDLLDQMYEMKFYGLDHAINEYERI